MNLTSNRLDRAVIARSIWEMCAIPAILYCNESMCVSETTLRNLEQVQNMIGRFILQIQSSSSRVFAWLDVGLRPMEHRVRHKKAVFIWSTHKKNHSPAMIVAFRHILDSPEDKWTMSWLEIQRDIGIISEFDF